MSGATSPVRRGYTACEQQQKVLATKDPALTLHPSPINYFQSICCYSEYGQHAKGNVTSQQNVVCINCISCSF